jgi:uncharacterized protein (TIRG00374 family)
MKQSRTLYWLISGFLAVALLYWSLRGIQWSQVWRSLASARLSYIGTCCLLISVNLFLRSLRWRILLSAEGRVSVADAFWATAAGYFGNNFLPARAGELIRTMIVSSRCGLSKAYVLTTALSERMVDAIVLVIISLGVLLILPAQPGWLADAGKPIAIIGIAGILTIAILPRLEPLLVRILRRIPLPQSMYAKLLHLLEQILLGVRTYHDARKLFAFLGFTVVIWLVDAVITVNGALAIGLSISLPIAFLLVAALGLGSALPSTPGYVGVYQFVAVSVLSPFGFSRNDAIAYILLFQALSYVVISLWGLLAFWQSPRALMASIRPASVDVNIQPTPNYCCAPER